MRLLGLLIAVVVFVGLGWTAFWIYAAGETGKTLDAWMQTEQAQGRRWTCPDRSVGGYPFAMEIACAHPAFAGLVLGDDAKGSLAGLAIRAALTDPSRATLTLTPPFAYRTADGANDFTIGWSRMAIVLDGVTDRITAATLSGADIAVQGQFGASGAQSGHAGSAAVSIADAPGTPDPAVDFAITVGGVGIPPLDAALGGVQPADLAFAGRLTHADLIDAPSTAALIEHWRQIGGTITFASASVTRGGSRVDATGPLQLDDAHRIQGKLDASFTGAGPILRRYGINPNLAAAGSILNSLFGGKHGGAAQPAGGPDAIRLPIEFRNGRLGVGPIVTPISLPPLY